MAKLLEIKYAVGTRANVIVEADDMTEAQLRAELELAKLGFDVQVFTNPAPTTQAPRLLAFNRNFGYTPVVVTVLRDGTEAEQEEKVRRREEALAHYLKVRNEGRW